MSDTPQTNTALDAIMDSIAKEMQTLDLSIAALFNVTHGLLGETPINSDVVPNPPVQPVVGKLNQLKVLIDSISQKNAAITTITQKLTETL